MADPNTQLNNEIKEMIINVLELEDITPQDIKDDEPLFGDGLGLDSIDALELGVAVQKKYKVKFQAGAEENKALFASVSSLTDYIVANRQD